MKHNFFIIGGGVAGLSVAYELLRQGQGVTLADIKRPGQSSWAGAGILCPLLPWDYCEEVNQLALDGMRAWPRLAAEIAGHSQTDPEYWACGMEIRTDSPEIGLEWARQHDFPAKKTADNRLFLPDVAQVRNPRAINAFTVAIADLGGRILPDCEITNVKSNGRKVVSVLSGKTEYVADTFIWAGGAWSGQELGQSAAVPNIRPVRGQMLLYAPGSHTLDHILYRDGLYLVPRRDGHLLAGSTTENAGFDTSTTPEILQDLQENACKLLPELLSHQPVRSWAGLRPGSPDNVPVIGQHADYDNLWVHTGHYRYGVTMAPASSQLLVEMMLGQQPHIDPTPYSWSAAQDRSWQGDAAC